MNKDAQYIKRQPFTTDRLLALIKPGLSIRLDHAGVVANRPINRAPTQQEIYTSVRAERSGGVCRGVEACQLRFLG